MVLLIAHGGASGEAPENTMLAVEKAFELGINCVEIDIRFTRDGIPVLFHDKTTSRTTDDTVSRVISEISYKELKKLDAGSWFDPRFSGTTVPTLDDVLQLNRRGAALMIDIKSDHIDPDEAVAKVLDTLWRNNIDPSDSILVGSLSPEIYRQVLLQDVGWSPIAIVRHIEFLPVFSQFDNQRIAIWYQWLTKSMIENFHDSAVAVWAFTVDDPKEAEFLRAIHIDGIITNHPGRMKESFV